MITKDTGPTSPLDGLFRCTTCMQQLHLSLSPSSGDLRYICQLNGPAAPTTCAAALVHHQVDQVILKGILQAVLTKENLVTALAAYNRLQTEDQPSEPEITSNQLKSFKDDPTKFVQALGGPYICRAFLAKFIEEVQLDEQSATVLYKIPLPKGSHLAGMKEQVIPLSPEELGSSSPGP